LVLTFRTFLTTDHSTEERLGQRSKIVMKKKK